MPALDMPAYARDIYRDCWAEAERFKHLPDKIRRRRQYQALAPVIYLRFYTTLVYARMVTPLTAFPSMLDKWLAHMQTSLLPAEREALLQAARDVSDVIRARMAKGESMPTTERLNALTLAGVIEQTLG